MNPTTYSLATESDIDTLVKGRILMLTAIHGPQPDLTVTQLKASIEQYFRRALASRSYISWIARSGDEVAGIGGLIVRDQPGNFKHPSGRVGYILNMYTSPEFRKQGIASTIVNKLIASANEMGVEAFELRATKDGEPVYQKLGFELHTVPTYRKYVSNSHPASSH